MRPFLVYILLFIFILKSQCQTQFPEKLPDRNNDGFSDKADFLLAFEQKKMSNNEIWEIFNTVDRNNDGLVSENEWFQFWSRFVKHFDECKKENPFLLNAKELKDCFDDVKGSDKFMDGVDAADSKDQWTDIIVYVSNYSAERIVERDQRINFYGYMFLIRVSKVWEKCVEDEAQITQAEFKNCGAQYMIQDKEISENILNYLFSTAVYYGKGKDIVDYKSINIMAFIYLFKKYFLFQQFAQNQNGIFTKINKGLGQVSKDELKQAVNQNLLSQEAYTMNLIDDVFGKLEEQERPTLDFKGFFILDILNDQANYYKNEVDSESKLIRVGRLSYENFDEFLNDKGFNVIILNAIDSCFNPESDSQKEQNQESLQTQENELLEAAENLILNPQPIQPFNMRYNSFLQVKMQMSHTSTHKSQHKFKHSHSLKSKLSGKYLEKSMQKKEYLYSNAVDLSTISEESPNKVIRKKIFKMFDSDLDGFLSTADLFRIVKYASFFHSFDPINKNVIFLHDLNQNKNKFGMAVPLTINEEKVFQEDLLSFDPKLPLNFLEVAGFFLRKQVFYTLVQKKHPLSSGIRLEDLTDGLSILGLTATPDDIKNSNYGMGSVLYDYDMAFKLAIRNYSNLVLDELEI